ncbi:MAG: hypothetical protein KFH98_10790, partial [Gemmatimonadetes bacterium]|nr:hypothetical protein [Gemmatimonadota bacterium]
MIREPHAESPGSAVYIVVRAGGTVRCCSPINREPTVHDGHQPFRLLDQIPIGIGVPVNDEVDIQVPLDGPQLRLDEVRDTINQVLCRKNPDLDSTGRFAGRDPGGPDVWSTGL